VRLAPASLLSGLLALSLTGTAAAREADHGLNGEVRAIYLQGQAAPTPALQALDDLRRRAGQNGDVVLRLQVDEAQCRLSLDIDQTRSLAIARAGLQAVAEPTGDTPAADLLRRARLRLAQCETSALSASGQEREALERLDQLEREAQARGWEAERALALVNRGALRSQLGDLANGQRDLLIACRTFQRLDDEIELAECHGQLANHNGRAGDLDMAIRLSRQLVERAESRGLRHELGIRLYNLAKLLVDKEEWPEARTHYEAALRLEREKNDPVGIAYNQRGLGQVLVAQHQADLALPLLREARATFIAMTLPDLADLAAITEAEALQQLGRHADALAVLAPIENAVRSSPGDANLLKFTRVRAAAQTALGQWRDAAGSLRELDALTLRQHRRQLDAQSAGLRLQFDRERDEARLESLEAAAAQNRQLTVLSVVAAALAGLLLLMTAAYAVYKVRLARRLQNLAMTDTLTGLPNRRAMEARASQFEARGAEDGGFAVVLMDLDHFKTVNDRHGHAGGDRVLAEVGRRLPPLLRQQDRLGRWGGEEFLVLLPGTDGASARQVAERMREAMQAEPVPMEDGRVIDITASLGVAEGAPGEGLEAVLARADLALYRAKAQGRDRVVLDTD
jgi:diguanylate cyclase (GGDEF)-like protein